LAYPLFGGNYVTAISQFNKLEVVPAYKLVFDAIEKQIVSRALNAGDLLPSEIALAEQLGVNRSTVREGIRLLEESGLVTRLGGKRLRVRKPDPLDSAPQVSRALILNEVTFQEMWEAATVLEPAVAGLAAQHITDDEIRELDENLTELEKNSADVALFMKVDIAFHDAIGRAARNRPLMMAREPVSSLLMPAGHAILPKLNSHQRVIDAHRQILNALRKRDASQAENWMRKHIADFKRGYEHAKFSPNSLLLGATATTGRGE
jgi:GntR family transcriptional repressor for pyruvate dehydrogenase complex